MVSVLLKMLPNPRYRRILMALVLTSVEAFVAVLCLFAGLPILFDPGNLAPSSILALLPGWAVYSWGIGMTIGGIATFLGIAFEECRLERIGVLFLASTVTVFALALIGFLPGSFLALLTFGFFSLSMYARYWVLGQLIKVREEIRNGG